ncbi:hypothetical protein GCM10008107_09580 [Psychrosphaera saromensis]|uniref:histidine kinase n=1 Tax=Psychrosphaera saromensis TaxID=716813 RepID=A0A2S7UW68_9GAMM|nr:ATP-binding protein [Psychrosphaera saromensis]PQJ53752.1 hypothetical protein BTO11_08815 [Psychrosphaera saromensis]GHB62576.1 hypothetical protein GCM10008107_09580 [Psychrosphaera saromensis]GLQ15461.1 hypothetical protein GCM10007917_29160 [Psychrosphaera saromensis]
MTKDIDDALTQNNKLLLFSIGGFALICLVIYVIYSHYAKEQIKTEWLDKLTATTNSSVSLMNKSFAQNKSNIAFLHSTPPIKGITRALNNNNIDPFDGTTTEQWKRRLEVIFSAFIVNNPDIRQIRYISKLNQGRELIRVERRDNKIIVVPDALLQSKQESDYYKAIKPLHIDEDYISDISLNREYGVLENPLWPTYRVAHTIFDQDYQFFGFIILNIDATSLLTQMKDTFSQSDFNFYLLNTQGYFISADREALTFGFDLNKPDAIWSKLTNQALLPNDNKINQLTFDQQKYYMYGSELRLSLRDFRSLNIIGGLSENRLGQIWDQQSKFVILILITLFTIVTLVTFYYQKYLNKILSLYDHQSRYEAIISGSSDAIIGLDVTGKILSWNESATYLFGLNDELAHSKNINEIIGVTKKDFLLDEALLSNIINKTQPVTYEVTNDSDKDNPVFLSVNLSPVIHHKSDTPASVAALIRDITESKVNQQKIINHNESLEKEVHQRTQELELLAKKAVDASQSKSAFVANISHEIRTPLNGISGMLELINKDPLTDKQTNYIKLAKSSISNLSVLINDLLNLSKIEAGKLDIELDEFNLTQTISSVIETMSIRCMEKNIDLLFDWTNIEHELLVSDDYRFQQVLVNLIGNAIKFTNKGTILVTAKTTINDTNPERVDCVITVQDTGLGMTAEEQEKLFQPFTQASANTDKQYGGTGLGLSISKKLVKLLGGRIHVTSVLNKGSTFTFSIQSKLIKHQISPLLSPKLLGKKIILISEQSQQYAPLLKQLRRWQAEVYLFNNQQAEQHISNTREPDLLFIDSHMLNNSAEKWHKLCDANSHCQLIILEDLKSELIAPDIYKGGFFVNTPLLPYQLLNIIDSIFNTGTANKLAENTVKKIDQPNKYSILVVDDNEINQIVAAGLLEALPVEITTASNGQEALDILNNTSTSFDLILMDCQMPIMDGFAATEAIRQGKAGYENSKISIIAMTAGAMSGDKDACLQSGMNDFIIKPLDGINFRSKVLSWLESS